jgi:glycine/D-amino acid oxidase-like deaminating enzyme
MQRRDFLKLSALGGLSACSPRWSKATPNVSVRMPGMQLGHMLRYGLPMPAPSAERHCEVAILGSGVAGLFAGWRLAQAGFKDFCLLGGPEPLGNAAGRLLGGVPCPSGAHYLPLPSMESVHVRDMLSEFGVLRGNPYALRPEYDERVLVAAPDERLLINGIWQDGLLPMYGQDAGVRRQIQGFLDEVAQLRDARGQDGRRAFTIPLEQASADPRFLGLDHETFADWLTRRGYIAEPLRWYLDYCCRDDYGAGIDRVSAWAGLHYFASRGGHAANAEDGSVLTWPDGLQPVALGLRNRIDAARCLSGMALKVRERGAKVEVTCYNEETQKVFTLLAKRVIVAMPLHVAMHVVEGITDFGFEPLRDLPSSAPWVVTNFLLNEFPAERNPHQPLAWDNVVYASRSLGWVVATHQWIRQAKPPQTVFTAYHALANLSAVDGRHWLSEARQESLLELALGDLGQAYGRGFMSCVRQAEITLRGHAMATPTPGFLGRPGIQGLRSADQRILFAHADLSGLSVFEEAAWWGEQAARRILA